MLGGMLSSQITERQKGRPVGGTALLPVVSRDDAIYLAGFFDGEGSVSIVLNRPTGKRQYHRLIARVTNTYPDIVKWIGETLDVTPQWHMRDNDRWKDAWEVTMWDARAEAFLRLIRPYVKVKHQQIDIGLELRATKGRGRPRRECSGDVLFDLREEMRQRLLVINRRGKTV